MFSFRGKPRPAPEAEQPIAGYPSGPGRSDCWRKSLIGTLESRSHEPFSAWRGELTEPNQRVIHADCERTRADMEFFRRPGVRRKMEAMLTCWCQQQKSKYKQGLNEVLAPFLYLQSEEQNSSPAPSDDEVFAFFTAFLKRFVPFFYSDDFVQLQSAFVFFRRLLLYHRPDLHNLLVERGVSPDMFCMPWFLTLFASKTPMKLVLQLWDRHLERGEPSFFIFLSVAVLTHAEKDVMSTERSTLPEILTSLGIRSRDELESLWTAAEGLHIRTPATFTARLRRNVLRIERPPEGKTASSSDDNSSEVDSGQILLERLEQERCFFILPEEVIGHCYPPKAGEVRKPWQPHPSCPWRLLVLDVRPPSDFEDARVPAAVHFDAFGNSVQNQAAGVSTWMAGRKLLLGGGACELEPVRVFDALKETLGEGWVCDSQAHICLLGATEDAALVRSLYEVLTRDLTLRHLSVASGGFEAVLTCAQKQGFEIIRTAPADGTLDRPAIPSAAAVAAEGAAAAAAAAAEGAASKLSSAWLSLKRVAGAGRAAPNDAVQSADTAEIAGSTVEASSSSAPVDGRPDGSSNAVPARPPSLLDRPGNWPRNLYLSQLPKKSAEELKSWMHWSCIAVVVRQSYQDDRADGADSSAAPAGGWPWEGCRSILSLGNGKITCATVHEEAAVLAEFSVADVLKVTSKKQAPDVLIFYFREASPGSPDPSMVLYFPEGVNEVNRFIKSLRGLHTSGKAVRTTPKPPDSMASKPLAPPPVAAEAAAVAVAAATDREPAGKDVADKDQASEEHVQKDATELEEHLEKEDVSKLDVQVVKKAAENEVEEPAESEDKETAEGKVKEPAESEVKEPAKHKVEEPSESEDNEPAASEVKEPAASEVKEHAESEVKERAESEVKEPTESEVKAPEESEVEEPAESEVKEIAEKVKQLTEKVKLAKHELTEPGEDKGSESAEQVDQEEPQNSELTVGALRERKVLVEEKAEELEKEQSMHGEKSEQSHESTDMEERGKQAGVTGADSEKDACKEDA